MIKIFIVLFFVALTVILTFHENYGYFKKCYSTLMSQREWNMVDIVDERQLNAEEEWWGLGYDAEWLVRLAGFLVMCAAIVVICWTLSQLRSEIAGEPEHTLETKLASIEERVERRLGNLENKFQDLKEEFYNSCMNVEAIYSKEKELRIHFDYVPESKGMQTTTPKNMIMARDVPTKENNTDSLTYLNDYLEEHRVQEEKQAGKDMPTVEFVNSPVVEIEVTECPVVENGLAHGECKVERGIVVDVCKGVTFIEESGELTDSDKASRGHGGFEVNASTNKSSNNRRIPQFQGTRKSSPKPHDDGSPPFVILKPTDKITEVGRYSRPATPRNKTSPEGSEFRRRKQRNYSFN